MVSKCFFQMRKLRKIHRLLTKKAMTQAVIATVLSHLDYANSVYLGLPACLTQRLQVALNQAARLIFGHPKWHSAGPLLRKLHWLPIAQRIMFKGGCVIFKSLRGRSPLFINELVTMHVPKRNLRSAHLSLLSPAKFRRARQGGRRFAVMAPKLWNSLPLALRQSDNLLQFRRSLKTWLFAQT